MKTITKVKQFVSTKSIGELLLIVYCAGLSAIFIYGICKVIYALVIDQSWTFRKFKRINKEIS